MHSMLSFIPGNAGHLADQLTAEQAVEVAKEAMVEVASSEQQAMYVVCGDHASGDGVKHVIAVDAETKHHLLHRNSCRENSCLFQLILPRLLQQRFPYVSREIRWSFDGMSADDAYELARKGCSPLYCPQGSGSVQ